MLLHLAVLAASRASTSAAAQLLLYEYCYKHEHQCLQILTFNYYTAVIISTVNYYARNDPLVFFDRRAASLMKQTENCTYQEVTYAKHNTTFVFLEGKARSPIFDHSLEGPTYQDALLLEARALRHRSHTPYPLAGGGYKRSWVRALRKQAAAATGVHSFWDDTAGLRKLRKAAADKSGMHGFFSGKRHYDFSGTAGSSFD
eukprot:822-Heterococcus_DN1.PRE.1